MSSPRYRRSSVRAVLESVTQAHAAAAEAHDALWAVLWNRRHDDVDEPVWLPDAAYGGVLVFARSFPDAAAITAVDAGDALIVFRNMPAPPPIGSRVRILPAGREQWKFADGVQTLGLGIDLRFDDASPATPDTAWIAQLRGGVRALGEALDVRREALAARRAALGALNEPASLEQIWRTEVDAIGQRVGSETDYTAEEHAAMRKAHAKGPRAFEDEERRIVAARRKRFSERGAELVQRFRETEWPEIRARALVELRKYAEYHGEVLRLEDAMTRMRTLGERAIKADRALDAIEAAGFRVRAMTFDPARLAEPGYPEELLRTIELLRAAIPLRASSAAASFSAYRAPTAGPSVIPPRV